MLKRDGDASLKLNMSRSDSEGGVLRINSDSADKCSINAKILIIGWMGVYVPVIWETDSSTLLAVASS